MDLPFRLFLLLCLLLLWSFPKTRFVDIIIIIIAVEALVMAGKRGAPGADLATGITTTITTTIITTVIIIITTDDFRSKNILGLKECVRMPRL